MLVLHYPRPDQQVTWEMVGHCWSWATEDCGRRYP